MNETYGFERTGPVFSKTVQGRRLSLTRLFTVEAIDPYMDVYQEIWGLTERERIPAHEPTVAARVGGLFLGVELDWEKIGLVYVVPAHDPDKGFYHHSKIMGFKAKYQGLGLGVEAKRVHAILAQEQGVKRVTWTFDPLMVRNASLNFRKLGGIARTYMENAYGNYGGRYDFGLPSDRFLIEWELESERVKTRLRGEGPTAEALWQQWKDAPVYADPTAELVAPAYRAEVPANVFELAKTDAATAQKEQGQFRDCLKRLLAAGYAVTEFLAEPKSGAGNYYLLAR